MHRMRTIAVVGGAIAFALSGTLTSGCTNSNSTSDGQTANLNAAGRGFVGAVEDSNALVAVVVSGGQAIVYVCDGNDDISLWFAGPGESSSIDLTNDARARVEAAKSGRSYDGTVTFAGGDRHEFMAAPAESGAGLLRVTGPEAAAEGVVAGWIVANDGETRGALRVGGTRRTAPAAPGGAVTVDEVSYPISVFLVPPTRPATPPGVPIPYPDIGSVAPATR